MPHPLIATHVDREAPPAALGFGAIVPDGLNGSAQQLVAARTDLMSLEGDSGKVRGVATELRVVLDKASEYQPTSDEALRAGARQRIGDFGLHGFAMASSATFGEGLEFGIAHGHPDMPFQHPTLSVKGDVAVLACQPAPRFGAAFPVVAEFWRSALNSLFQRVIGMPFPARRLVCNYPAPSYWRSYAEVFGCPADFDADVMEWHFDAAILDAKCPGANTSTRDLCRRLCVDAPIDNPQPGSWAGRVRTACLEDARCDVSVGRLADCLGVSVRTLHRRLADEGLTFKTVVDQSRKELAIGFLRNSRLSVGDIAERVGFSEATNFRKAFRRWTGKAPSDFRALA